MNLIRYSLMNTLQSNTTKCKKLATIALGRKSVTRPFISEKYFVNNIRCSYFVTFCAYILSLDVIRFFNSKQLLRVSCIFCQVIIYHFSKQQFLKILVTLILMPFLCSNDESKYASASTDQWRRRPKCIMSNSY